MSGTKSSNLATWRSLGIRGAVLFAAILLVLPGLLSGVQGVSAEAQAPIVGSDPSPGPQDDQANGETSEPSVWLRAEPAEALSRTDLRELSQVDPLDVAGGGVEEANPFRPTMDEGAYRAQKARAAQGAANGMFAPNGGRSTFRGRSTLSGGAGSRGAAAADMNDLDQKLGPAIPVGPVCRGATQFGSIRPPDTHGAVGLGHYVEIVNTRLHVFNRSNCASLNGSGVSLNSFFATVSGQPSVLFDPRVIYDHIWNRWIMTAEGFPLDAARQFHYINVSTTSNPLGGYHRYAVEVNFLNTSSFFWDYPQLGMDQDAIIITANIFNPGFAGAAMFAVAKARLYNGLGFAVPLHFPLTGTLAPPIVLDQNNSAFLVAAWTNSTSVGRVRKYELLNASNASQQVLRAPVDIAVFPYTIPPDARQPGTSAVLDTLDRRFVNASTQIGNFLYQVHTVNSGGLPTPRWYELHTGANVLTNIGQFFEARTSNDFNASIAANESRDLFVTWTTTDPDPPTPHQALMRVSGKRASDFFIASPGFQMGPASQTFYTQGRWGDYSAVVIDPLDRRLAWAVNETILNNTTWNSIFGRMRRDPF